MIVKANARTKNSSWQAFRTGLSHAARYRWVLLILFAVNVIAALLLVALPAFGLASWMGRRPAINQAADGIDSWLIIETLMTPASGITLGGESLSKLTSQLRQATLLGLLTMLALPLAAGLPAAFLSGGVLAVYAEALRAQDRSDSTSFGWRRFLWGCYHWFGAFLLLGILQGLASTVIFIPLIGAAIGAVVMSGGWLVWIVGPLVASIAVLWLALIEYTRLAAVLGETRNLLRAFSKAARFLFRNLLKVLGLYGLALLLLGTLHAVYRWGLMPYLPLNWWPLVLVVQQGFILARLWARLVRLAGGMMLYRELSDSQSAS